MTDPRDPAAEQWSSMDALAKVEWMIETHGYAVDPNGADASADPPRPATLATIGFPEAFGFPEVLVCGLAPAEAGSLVDRVADLLRGGTEIPVGVVVVGLLDGDQRALFTAVADDLVGSWLPGSCAWRGSVPAAVQLLWPDRNGFLPHEPGFERRLALAQPVMGVVPE